MRIAYLILAHNTPNHVGRLVRALDSPNADFLIHIDRKSDIWPFRVGISQPNVTFIEDRVAVYWGDFSDVEATIRLIREALNRWPKLDYLALLSGSDYPLRSPRCIDAFFSRNQGRQFMNLVRVPCDAVGKPLERFQRYWLRTPCNIRLVIRVIARLNDLNQRLALINLDYEKVFKDLKPYGGSQWWALSSEACRHILSFIDSRPEVVKFFKNVYLPDESFFQTIIGNSKFAAQVARNLTFTDWSRPSGGPALIDMDHLHAFLNAEAVIGDDPYGRGELLFARKFTDDSSQLTDFIDERVINRPSNHDFSVLNAGVRV